MKRYLLFAGDRYYPLGGWEDFQDSFDTEEETRLKFDFLIKDDTLTLGWGHIYDTQTDTIIKLKPNYE